MKYALIEILIPTFNREKFLLKNVSLLVYQIQKGNLEKSISISISDNASTDETKLTINKYITEHENVTINYSRNKENIGLEPNALKLLENAKSPYILWLGDDDCLAEGYLQFLIKRIEGAENIGCVLPGLTALYFDGRTKSQRVSENSITEKIASYESMLEWSHLAHQMSGILLLRDGLFNNYTSFPEHRNPYLFIYLSADRLLKYDSIYAPMYETKVSDFNSKDWGYNNVGLLDEVFKSYYPFLEILGKEKVRGLLLKFSVIHSYRYNINRFSPLKLLNQYKYLTASTPKLRGFKKKLAIQLIKDYLLSFVK